MEKTNEAIASTNTRDDIIELGVASVDTKGGGFRGEELGDDGGSGISEE